MNRDRLLSERGQALPLVALGIVMLVSMMGLVIDFGYALSVRHQIQASTDAAASAGAMDIGVSGGNPTGKATLFSSVPGNKNARASLGTVSLTAQVKCTNFVSNLMTGTNCTNATTPPNTIVVTQSATINTFFAKVLGYQTLTVSAQATAAVKGGGMPPLDVAIVVDSTGSMGSSCSGTVPGVSSPTRLDCAKYGIRTLLTALTPCSPSLGTAPGSCGAISGGNVPNPIDKVALLTFPGLKTTSPISEEFDCATNVSSTDLSPYNLSPVYTMVGLVSDYKTSAYGALNGAVSNLVKSVDWTDGNTCTSSRYGLEHPGGQGSYFADAIIAAQSLLLTSGRANVQDVIVFVSDGDGVKYTGGPNNPCRLAVSAADAAAAAGTWVYAVAYSSPTSGGCANDTPAITPYATMQGIASDATKFFSTATAADLLTAFQKIGQSLMTTRLIDNSTT